MSDWSMHFLFLLLTLKIHFIIYSECYSPFSFYFRQKMKIHDWKKGKDEIWFWISPFPNRLCTNTTWKIILLTEIINVYIWTQFVPQLCNVLFVQWTTNLENLSLWNAARLSLVDKSKNTNFPTKSFIRFINLSLSHLLDRLSTNQFFSFYILQFQKRIIKLCKKSKFKLEKSSIDDFRVKE